MLRFVLLIMGVVAVVGGLGFADYRSYLQQPVAISEAQREFTIERGWSAKRVSRELVRAGIIDKPYWFDLYARLSKKAGAIKSGEFVLQSDLTVPMLLDVFIKGQTRQYSLGIIEGSTFRQLRAHLVADGQLTQTLADKTGADVMALLGAPELHPEGQFFADTYSFPKNTIDLDYLQRAHRMLGKVLESEWAARDDGLPLDSAYEALILASIVEKETAVAAERPIIAGVFLSRLTKGMRLQTDPTVIYGMGENFDGNIRRSDLTTDTPWNTYTRGGLPPTPIAMVGRDAIHAVLHPATTTALYFVARGDGTHQFSDTLEQHNDAVSEFQLKRRRKPRP